MNRPTLSSFRLVSIEAKSPDIEELDKAYQVRLSTGVELALATVEKKETKAPVQTIAMVRVRMEAKIIGDEEIEAASMTALYIGRFAFRKT